MSAFSVGDQVTVKFSGTVEANVGEGYVGILLDDGLIHWVKGAHVEKVEPEFEVFKPGDVVREKGHGTVRALAYEGYVIVGHGVYYPYGGGAGFDREWFTSKDHERVQVG